MDTPGRGLLGLLADNKAFIVVWLTVFISITGIGMVSPLLPVFAEDMGASGVWLGLAFSGFAISQIPLMPVVGRLSDQLSRKSFLQCGLLIYAIVGVGYVWAPGYHELVLFRIVSGVGSAMVIPVAFAYAGELAPPGHEGRYMGLFNVSLITGFGLGPLLGGSVHDSLGMDVTFASMAVLSLLGVMIVSFFLPRAPSSNGVALSEADEDEVLSSSYASMLKNRVIQSIVTFQMVFGLFIGTLLAFVGVWMTTVLETSVSQVGIVLATRFVLNGALGYPFGWLADRMNRALLATTGMVVVAIGTFSIPWLGSFTLLLGLFVIMGIFESMAVPSLHAIAVKEGRGMGMGSVMAISNTAISVGLITGSMAGGVIESSVGIVEVFQYTAVLGLVGIVIFNLLMARNRRSPS